ncbi:MAG: chondroitinase-B domain-containing protein [Saprospiraceae bacterium]
MFKNILFISLIFLLASCQNETSTSTNSSNLSGKKVSNAAELKDAIANATPGDNIILTNGVWTDVQINFTGKGTEAKPISLRAETPGKVFIEGQSCLKLAGEYLNVDGLYFQNGYTPTDVVIEFRINKDSLASHCKVTNCVIENFNQPHRDRGDLWVEFYGRHNTFDHCYLAGKSNQGPTLRVDIKGNQSINNYHKITNNYFGPRPRKGGAKAETIQLGSSFTSMSPSYTTVANNLFERCNGEVEVISSKTNFNIFSNNVFYKSEGSLVTRHGNYCRVDGNYFIGDGNANVGGVRLINTGRWVVNNYFYNLKGKEFRSPLAIMNGIPKSPLNRYNQVTDVVVAYNTYINCEEPWHFGVGTNISQKDVLPLSEIRSARAIRTTVANNIIYNKEGNTQTIVAHDQVDGISFKSNLTNNKNIGVENLEGLKITDFEIKEVAENIYIGSNLPATNIYNGFDFETIEKDLFGNLRKDKNSIGAVAGSLAKDPMILDKKKYGPSWFSNEAPEVTPETFAVNSVADLSSKIKAAKSGDIIELAAGNYELNNSLIIDKNITVKSKDNNNQAKIIYSGAANTPAFEMHPNGNLSLSGVILMGKNTQYAFATLKENMSSLYNLSVMECEISNFNYVLKAYKESMADEITFIKSSLKNCANGLELSEEINDKGDYNVEFLTIENCQFENIKSNVIDYYRGGYDESTIGGNLNVHNSTFTNCGSQEKNGILLNTRGIINVDISKNTFKNNRVKLIALLWGAKNNTHSENEIINSGKMLVQENIKLKLMY